MVQVIRVEIDELSQFDNEHKAYELKKPIEIDNLHWTLGAFSETSSRTANVRHLGVVLYCNKENRSNLWSVSTSIQLKLVKQGTQLGTTSPEFRFVFSANENRFEKADFINWQEAVSPENGYVVDDTTVVEAHVRIEKVIGIHRAFDFKQFSEKNEQLTDLELVFENKSIFVSKQLLAQHCNFFFNQFSENHIVIDDVSHSDFIDFLHFIYPTRKPIDAKNVASVLKLAARFEAPFVLEKCEHFLVSTEDFHLVEKLKYAEMYRFSSLQIHCLKELKTNQDVMGLTKHEKYCSLGGVTSEVLLQKITDFSRTSESDEDH